MFLSGEVLSVIDMFPVKSQSPLGVSWNPNFFGYKLAVLAFAQSVHNVSAELTSLRDSHEGLKTSLNCTFVLIGYYTTSGTRKFAFIFVLQFCD